LLQNCVYTGEVEEEKLQEKAGIYDSDTSDDDDDMIKENIKKLNLSVLT